MGKWTGWWSLPSGPARQAAKAAGESRVESRWPVWETYRGAGELRVEPDAVVAINGRWIRRFPYSTPEMLPFAKLFATAGLPRELCELSVEKLVSIFDPRAGATAARAAYTVFAESENAATQSH